MVRDAFDDPTRRAWDGIWRTSDLALEHATGRYDRARAIRDRYLRLLPDDGVVLEAGCGVGTELVALAGLGRRVVGIDYSLPGLGKLRVFDPQAPLAGADIHRLPVGDGALAAYLSFGVLEHFEWGPKPALTEALRVLRPGGVLVLTVPAPNLVWRGARFRRRWLGGAPGADYYETTYRLAEIRDTVVEVGFADVCADPIDHSFTLWGCGGPFRGAGHYVTSGLAETFGRVAARLAPRALAFATMVTARKPGGQACP